MIALRADLKVVVASHPIAFRRGGAFTALSRWWPRRRNPPPIVPTCSCSGRSEKTGCFWRDGNGIVLATKWLEEGAFTWPPITAGRIELSPEQMAVLAAGLDWTKVGSVPVKRPTKVG